MLHDSLVNVTRDKFVAIRGREQQKKMMESTPPKPHVLDHIPQQWLILQQNEFSRVTYTYGREDYGCCKLLRKFG